MSSRLIPIIISDDPAIRDQSLETVCADGSVTELIDECGALEAFRRSSQNLYQRVRALFFLYAIYRFHLPSKTDLPVTGSLPIELQVGAVSESVQVTGNATVVDTRSATLATVVDDRRVVDLPISNRNVMGLAVLLPGVTQVNAP